jgi:hypothetical protein
MKKNEGVLRLKTQSYPEIDNTIFGWHSNKLNDLVSEMINIEEKICKKAVSEHLGREATIEDFKKCERRILNGKPNKYKLLYNSIPLGYIKRVTANPSIENHSVKINSSVMFIPEAT